MAGAVEGLGVVRKGDFAAALGVHKSRVSQLVKQGMPVREDGFVDVAAALDWLRENWDGDTEKLKAAREALLGPRKRPALKRWTADEVAESGLPAEDFIAVAEAEAQDREWAARIQEGARALPDRLAGRLAKERDPARVKAIVGEEIARFLDEAAQAVRPRA